MRILVTGGCGFIGSNFVRFVLDRHPEYQVVNLDALTYAGNRENLRDMEDSGRYRFIHGRVEDPAAVTAAMAGADAVVHFAAESHVDRSIADAAPFVLTNVVGTQVLLDAARLAGVRRLVHVSTDEVYGALGEEGLFTEDTPLHPRSPYAASKAAADLLVQACHETHGLPVCIVRPSNNYGPYQLPEKLIPLMVTNLVEGKRLPVYGKGQNVRDWVFVEDNCRGIDAVLREGRTGEAYNIGGGCEKRNIEVTRTILRLMGKGEEWVEYVPDRPGHDYRYALDCTRIRQELGWIPAVSFGEGISRTVKWYVDHPEWWRSAKARLARESAGFWTDRR